MLPFNLQALIISKLSKKNDNKKIDKKKEKILLTDVNN